jgi:ATP-binding cassette subfamily F protein uup
LDHFQGCLVVASHDLYFLDRTVDYLVSFELGGQVGGRYPAPYEVYRALREQEARPARQEGRRAASGAASPPTARPVERKLSWREQRELEGLEARIAELEARRAALQEEVAGSAADYVRLQALAAELHGLEEDLDAAMGRWLELAEVG